MRKHSFSKKTLMVNAPVGLLKAKLDCDWFVLLTYAELGWRCEAEGERRMSVDGVRYKDVWDCEF